MIMSRVGSSSTSAYKVWKEQQRKRKQEECRGEKQPIREQEKKQQEEEDKGEKQKRRKQQKEEEEKREEEGETREKRKKRIEQEMFEKNLQKIQEIKKLKRNKPILFVAPRIVKEGSKEWPMNLN